MDITVLSNECSIVQRLCADPQAAVILTHSITMNLQISIIRVGVGYTNSFCQPHTLASMTGISPTKHSQLYTQ
jgi:hypothetical protein